MAGLLLDTADLADRTGISPGTAHMGAWHAALTFARDYPELAADLLAALDVLRATIPYGPPVSQVNDALVRAANPEPEDTRPLSERAPHHDPYQIG